MRTNIYNYIIIISNQIPSIAVKCCRYSAAKKLLPFQCFTRERRLVSSNNNNARLIINSATPCLRRLHLIAIFCGMNGKNVRTRGTMSFHLVSYQLELDGRDRRNHWPEFLLNGLIIICDMQVNIPISRA
jgi:hypothetical protein